MQRVPQAAVGSLFLFVAVSATVGLFIGSVSWGMVAGLGLWIFLQLRQIGRLQTWLHKYDSEVPEAIPERNIAHLEALGRDKLIELFPPFKDYC